MALVRGLQMPFPGVLLALYPAVVWALMWLGKEDIVLHLPTQIQYLRLGGMTLGEVSIWGCGITQVVRFSVIGVCLLNTWSVARKTRTYQLSPNESSSIIHKWDISDTQLTLACLFSPLHIPLTILLAGSGADEGVACVVAVLHGYLNLLLAHKFLQRESIDMAIFRGVYGVEVDYREKMLLMRRLGQRDVWSELGLWSKAGQGER